MQKTPSAFQKYDWFSLMQFGFSLLGGFFLWGLAFINLVFALVNQLTNSIGNSDFGSSFMLAVGLIVCGFLLLLSALYSVEKAFNRSLPWLHKYLPPKIYGWSILALPLVLLIGNWLANQSDFGWVFLPGFHALALGIPIIWMIHLGKRGLPSGSPQRRWGLFSVGMTLTPGLILILELFVMVFFILIAAIWLSNTPELFEEMSQLSQNFDYEDINPEKLYRDILPFISHPGVFIFTIAFTSILVPLIEETLKPLGVWFLIKRKLTPSEGFIAGLLCGAGYGWLENIALTYSTPDWITTVTGRMGTSLIHMATTSLTGWGLVYAWNHKKYLHLAGAFLLAVLLHGMWNGLAVSYAFASLLNKNAPILVERLGLAMPLGLFVLATTSFLLIILGNRRIQKQSIAPSSESPQPQIQE